MERLKFLLAYRISHNIECAVRPSASNGYLFKESISTLNFYCTPPKPLLKDLPVSDNNQQTTPPTFTNCKK
jgi:hypothetical protein